MIDEWVTIISQVGFPIAMCIYFAMRFEKILKNNTNALIKLERGLQKWTKK